MKGELTAILEKAPKEAIGRLVRRSREPTGRAKR